MLIFCHVSGDGPAAGIDAIVECEIRNKLHSVCVCGVRWPVLAPPFKWREKRINHILSWIESGIIWFWLDFGLPPPWEHTRLNDKAIKSWYLGYGIIYGRLEMNTTTEYHDGGIKLHSRLMILEYVWIAKQYDLSAERGLGSYHHNNVLLFKHSLLPQSDAMSPSCCGSFRKQQSPLTALAKQQTFEANHTDRVTRTTTIIDAHNGFSASKHHSNASDIFFFCFYCSLAHCHCSIAASADVAWEQKFTRTALYLCNAFTLDKFIGLFHFILVRCYIWFAWAMRQQRWWRWRRHWQW